ncbi:MAG TPA: L-threonylcarbamoyladenylate synthase [Polyangiales bacterium]|jgi:L-threonylcarbamoyladenylate synthase|nr:L-threonylcarbamoyladenylate synthase [Polyangiales bacterium]
MSAASLHPALLDALVRVLRAGGVVACPTETFFGLLADARNPAAVQRVCDLKGRSEQHTMGVLVPDLAALQELVVDIPPRARALAEQHWPGPLTLVLRVREGLPAALHKDGKLGARIPGPSPALDLVRAFGGALTATSANKTGEPAAVNDGEVQAAFGSALDAIVAGTSPGGLPSTLVDATSDALVLIREGAVILPR